MRTVDVASARAMSHALGRRIAKIPADAIAMHAVLFALLLPALQFPETSSAPRASAPLAGFKLVRRDLSSPRADALSRADAALHNATLARPSTYVDAIGQRAYVAASEDGPIEAWVWPLQIFVAGRFTFQPEKSSEALDLMRRARSVDVEPQSTLIEYATTDLVLTSETIALDGERAIVMLLRADLDGRGTLRFWFTPKLEPQWPASVGGVAGAWAQELGGFAISEPSAKFAAVVACPWATSGTEGLQYLLPDSDLRIEIPLDAARCADEIVPLVITAAEGDDAPARARETYLRVVRSIPELVRERESAWKQRLADFPTVSLPTHTRIESAFRDACITLAQSLVKSDALGDGCVAGFGPAGATSQRPGFAWYFTGDVGFNASAYAGAGLFDTLGAALRFAARHQRDDGKIPHEVVQSAQLCDWFARYPFAYIHGDTTALWLHALRLEIDASGDRALLAELWPAVVKAYAWMAKQDADGDGLPDNARAGMGASEVGALLAELRTDIHLAAAFTAAADDVAVLAHAMHDEKLAQEATHVAERARKRLNEAFWDANEQCFGHALLADGTLSRERSAWLAIPEWLGVADAEHARSTLERIARPDLSTSWGVRILASSSQHYEPKGYNSGAVWPFLTGIAAVADFRSGRADSGWKKIESLLTASANGPHGCAPEVLSGSRPIPLEHSVPRQVFSSAAVVASVVNGVFGFEPKLLDGAIDLAPCLPPTWNNAVLRGVRAGKQRVTIALARDENDRETLNATVDVSLGGDAKPLPIRFTPRHAKTGKLDVRTIR